MRRVDDFARFQEAWQAYDRGGVEALLPYIGPDAVWEEYPGTPGAETWHGPDGVRGVFRRWEEDFADFRFERRGEPVALAPDTFAVRVRVHGVGRLSGAEVDIEAYHVSRVAGGLAVHGFFAPTLDDARRRMAA